jgi:amino acid adenylation domain-containing protein/thioester reductase-like protein
MTTARQTWPLTHPQQRIFLVQLMHPGTSVWNVPYGVRVDGVLNTDAMQKALDLVVAEMDALRIRFVDVDGETRQYITEPYHAPLDVVDPGGQGDECYEAWAASFAVTPIWKMDAPLFRVACARISDNRWGLVFKFHHIIADGSGALNCLSNLLDRYHECLNGGTASPVVQRSSYLEYLNYERAYLESPQAAGDRNFWMEQFAALPDPVRLFPHIPEASVESRRKTLTLPMEFSGRIYDFCEARKSSPFRVILAALYTWIARTTRNPNAVIGTAFLNRDDPGMADIAGMLVSTIPIRLDAPLDRSFTDLLTMIRERTAAIRGHERYPFDLLLRDLRKRDGQAPDLIQISMAQFMRKRFEGGEELEFHCRRGLMDPLLIYVSHAARGERDVPVELFMDYQVNVFTEERIEMMGAHLLNIIADALDNPGRPLADLKMLPEYEQRRLLEDFNPRPTPLPAWNTVVEAFERHANERPERTALVSEDLTLSYGELNSRAAVLALLLRSKGVESDDVVAIMADRSGMVIVAMLAALKAGAGYTAVDPKYPAERIRHILENAAPKVLLGNSAVLNGVEFEGERIKLDDTVAPHPGPLSQGEGDGPSSSNLAYIIYTSGSTGKPKGVMVEHRSLVNFLNWYTNLHGFTPEDNAAAYASFSFDASVAQVWAPLASGASLHVIPEYLRLSAQELSDYFEANDITHAHFPTQFAEQFFNTTDNRSLKRVVVGGDALRSYRIGRYRIVNEYGPSETTVASTAITVDRQYKSVPIGKPADNTRVYILDGQLKLQPIGVPGEICIAGAGLARGYRNNPEQTAERFVQDPFTPGTLMYRTGDMGRWLPDGNLEFLGRIDFQLKIRGFRIEPAEIEQAIQAIPEVRRAVTLALEDDIFGKYLCAWYEADEEIPLSRMKLHLSSLLPEYMIPQAFVCMTALPINRNGKIDRPALPKPEMAAAETVRYVPPRNELEQKIVDIWQETLKLPHIGIDDDFFALGGQSLKAAFLLSRMEKQIGVRVTMRSFFNAPTIRQIAENHEDASAATTFRLLSAPPANSYPLTAPQSQLYALSRMEEIGVSYNIPIRFTFNGPLDRHRLADALNRLVERHEVLRTSFAISETSPVQIVHPPQVMEFPFIEADENEMERLTREFIRPFDLEQSPLFRIMLISTGKERHHLLFDIHHIVCDGVSVSTLVRDLNAFYNDSKLEPRALQFKDYAVWQAAFLASDESREMDRFWRELLEEAEPSELRTDFPRGRSATFEGGVHNVLLDAEEYSAIQALARGTGATLHIVLMAALHLLVSRYSRMEDVVTGTTLAGRIQDETREMVGMFVNTLPVRSRPLGTLSFREYLKEMKQIMLGIHQSQAYPLEEIFASMGFGRGAGRHPLFDINLALQNIERSSFDAAGLTVDKKIIPTGISKFDMSIIAEERDSGLSFRLEYPLALYEHETVVRFAGHFMNILNGAARNPETPLARIPMLSEAELRRVLVHFNDTARDFPRDKTLHGLFEEQVERTPDKPALVYRDSIMTYAELNRRANSLARHLREHGARPDTIVGLLVDRTMSMIIGALGILKSGAAYAPIDPQYPDDRIAYMLENSKATLLVTQAGYVNKMNFTQKVVDLDGDTAVSGDGSNLPATGGAENISCLIYTSGSTGNPKGVMLEHRSLVNITCAQIADRKLTAEDRIAKQASFSFDASIIEIYPCLSVGATMHIIPDEIRLNLVPLNDYYEEHGITACFFTTQLGEQFMELFDNTSLRYLDLGGEKLRSFKQRNFQLYNVYGPTETSVYCTSFPVDREYVNIPIGKPIANYRLYILDPHGNLQPPGVPGELCISGIPLARGYWDLPEKTAAAFTANPFYSSSNPDDADYARLYRTGDLACWLPDGNIEHLGRIDRQVKIRGYRIEPGEIEAVILSLPDVAECAVIDLKDASGRLSLCAYVVASRPFDRLTLLREGGTRLPDYMMPQYVIRMESLPLTGSGKIDRKVLPRPEAEAGSEAVYAAPRSELEQQMVRIWQEVLKRELVGIDDNFSAIGGQSLKAAFLLARMEKQLGVRVGMAYFYAGPTIRQVADAFKPSDEPEEDLFEPAPVADFYPLTPSQGQLFVLSRMESVGTSYNVPVHLVFTGKLDTAKLSKALQGVVERHESLRTSFRLQDNDPVQTVQSSVRMMNRMEAAEEASVERLAVEFIRPFNLENPPLFRALLIETGPDRHHLLLDLHHIVCDGVSVAILLRDLNALYRGDMLEPLALQSKDYAVWHKKLAGSRRFEEMGAFWRDLFRDPQPSELQTDRPRGVSTDFNGEECQFVLDRDLYGETLKYVRQSGCTLHILMMSVLHLLVGRYTRQEDVITGTTMAGRTRDEVKDIIGMFVNTVPVRSFPKSDSTFNEFLKSMRSTMLEIHENQIYPLERVYESLKLRRGAGRHPLFDINFILQNVEGAGFSFEGLAVERRPFGNGKSKFDMSIAATEQGGDLRFRISYRSSLYDRSTIERFSGHFMNLLADAVRNPNRKIAELEMLSVWEKQHLLSDFNPSPTPCPSWQTVVEAFRSHAAVRPERIALVAEDMALTYGELDVRSEQLAHLLRAKRVGGDEVVAIMADRSGMVVIAMLAILKAGGAYTAVDPKYPAERIRHILESADARVLLGNSAVLSGVEFPGERIALDDLSLTPRPDPLPQGEGVQPCSTDLAYIIYTSGSTGKPKGVMIAHAALVNFLNWYTTLHGFTPEDNSAAFASFSFDACVAQVWAPLVSGASLHIIPEELRLSPAELSDYFEANSVTHAHFPTQFAEQFMALTENRSLKRMVVGGDALRSYKLGNYKIVNEYGPSETTVASTAITVDREYARVPIGKPADNTRVYILDSNLKLQPVGVPGEICIAGAGLARGYRNNPEQTAEKFVADPFAPGKIMYRTGDLGRWLPDGNLEFIGRVDFQVKIRGFRIELVEIEQALISQDAIRRSVVMARSDDDGNKFLCAYYEADALIDPAELKQRLAAALPEYMIPSAFVWMAELPINRNGKIDRSALPDPVFAAVAGEVVPPGTPIEEDIAAAWRTVLKDWHGGIHDNFFEVGGDSLRAIALVAQLQKNFNVRIADIFAYPSIAQQGKKLVPVKDNLKQRLYRLKDSLAAAANHRRLLAEDSVFTSAVSDYLTRNEEFERCDFAKRHDYQHVLLTGATGYLGVYILRELLHKRSCHVTLPVRGADNADALQRLQNKLLYYFGADFYPHYQQRITVLASDLRKTCLGMDSAEYEQLAESVDCIMHAAANVRHYGLYEEFHASNVTSTEHLLELATTGAPKAMHHISTTSTGHGVTGCPWVLFTEDDLEIGQTPGSVYVRSKLAAERLVVAAREKGINTCIHRVGNICYDSVSGQFQENIEENGFFQQVKGYANIGAAPDLGDERNLTFVDRCAAAIVTLFDCIEISNQIFHFSNPHRAKLSQLLPDKGLGLNLNVVRQADFIDLLAERFDIHYFRQPIENLMLHQGWLDGDPSAKATILSIRTERTDRMLERAGFSWPKPESQTIRRMVLAALSGRSQFLSQMSVFSYLDQPEIEALALAARPVWQPVEADVSREGEEEQRIYAVVDGNLEASRLSRDGWVGTIRLLGPGELIGKDLLLHDLPSPVTIQSIFDGVVLLEFNPDDLKKLLQDSPYFALGLAKSLSHSVNRLESLFVNMG